MTELTELGDANRRIEAAYQKGLEERAELERLNPAIVKVDTNIQKAIDEKNQYKKTLNKLERGADAFERRFAVWEHERARERELEAERQRQALEKQQQQEREELSRTTSKGYDFER